MRARIDPQDLAAAVSSCRLVGSLPPSANASDARRSDKTAAVSLPRPGAHSLLARIFHQVTG
jgi:hypothetical protein